MSVQLKKPKPEFDLKACMACGICVQACPFGCLELSVTGIDRYGKSYPALVKPDRCTGCGICSQECPFEAVVVKRDGTG